MSKDSHESIMKNLYDIEQLRDYTSLFSGRVHTNILRLDDFSDFHNVIAKYDSQYTGDTFHSYWDYLKLVYRVLAKYYRSEYIYKNIFLNEILLKTYGIKSTVAFSEFKVGKAIADLALFNGASKAFEIKTELDNEKRLCNQLNEYSKLFEECYIVVPIDILSKYEQIVTDNIGIIIFEPSNRGRYSMHEIRHAQKNDTVDINVLMSSVRCTEYKNMVLSAFGKLPDVSCFEMYDTCKSLLHTLPASDLQQLFLQAIKSRKSTTPLLRTIPAEIRQLCLSMNISHNNYLKLKDKINRPIIL